MSSCNIDTTKSEKLAEKSALKEKSSTSSSVGIVTLILLFVAWYAFNGGYNVFHAYVKSDIPYPIFVAVAQLAIGWLYAVPLWLLQIRKAPSLTLSDIARLLPIGKLRLFC